MCSPANRVMSNGYARLPDKDTPSAAINNDCDVDSRKAEAMSSGLQESRGSPSVTRSVTERESKWNRNVILGFVFRISNGAAQSVWGNSILALWIFVVEGSNSDATVKVGLASSFQGMATVLVGWFAGWAADKLRRDNVIALGGVTGLLAIATTVAAVLSGPCHLVKFRFVLTCTACALWGVFQGVTNASIEALPAFAVRGSS